MATKEKEDTIEMKKVLLLAPYKYGQKWHSRGETIEVPIGRTSPHFASADLVLIPNGSKPLNSISSILGQ